MAFESTTGNLETRKASKRRPGRWRVALGVGATLVVSLAAVYAGVQLRAQQRFRDAQDALAGLDFDRARQDLEDCLKITPRNASVYLLAAQAARRGDAPDDADRFLAEYEQLQGVTPASARERALLRAQEGDLADVAGSLQALVDQDDPQAPLILEALAQGYLNTFHFAEAERSTEALLRRQPNHHRALVWRGRIRVARNKDEEALRDFERAVELVPGWDEARLHYADALDRVGRVPEAVGQYGCLLRRLGATAASDRAGSPPRLTQPWHTEIVVQLARCRFDLHDLAAARQLLDGLLAEQPRHVRALVERGRLALHEADFDRAELRLREAVVLAPHDRDAHAVLHQCLDRPGKGAEAAKLLARLLQVEVEAAHLAALTQRAQDAPKDPAPRYEIGVLLLRKGDDRQGVRWLLSALQEEPNHQLAKAALAEYYQRASEQGSGDRGQETAKTTSRSP
jgi:predicted Zn-dependent protease